MFNFYYHFDSWSHERYINFVVCLSPEGAVAAGGALQEGDDEQCPVGQREADVSLPGGSTQGQDGRSGGTTDRGAEGASRPLQGQWWGRVKIAARLVALLG